MIDSKYVFYGIMIEDGCDPASLNYYKGVSEYNIDDYSECRGAYDEIYDKIIQKDWHYIDDTLNYLLAQHGLLHLYEVAFSEVHASNMSKACLSKEEADRVVENYSKTGELCYHKKINDKYIVCNSNDKVRKGEQFFEPNLKAILYEG